MISQIEIGLVAYLCLVSQLWVIDGENKNEMAISIYSRGSDLRTEKRWASKIQNANTVT